MKKIIVFGAGNTAEKVSKYINKRTNVILCYADNDIKKHGKKLNGKEIIDPKFISSMEYDYIIIASIYWREIRKQMISLGVDAEKIKCPLAPTRMKYFKKEYKHIYNIFGKIIFYYNKWNLAEQFNPDWMGVFVNPYFISRKKIYKDLKEYAHYISGKCMDFGCGIQPYRKFLAVDKYVGVEIETENKAKNIVYYDGHTLPFVDKEFDSIISSEVFEHVYNIEEILLELNRVLKNRGIMLLTVPFAYPKHCWPCDYRRYTSEGLKYLLANAGFEIVECKTSSNYLECLAQLKNVYWKEEIKPRTIFGKIICEFQIVKNNLSGSIIGKIMPISDKMYLDNVMVVRKISS